MRTALLLLVLSQAGDGLDEVLRRASADPDVHHACAVVDGWLASRGPQEAGRALLWQAQALSAVDDFRGARAALARLATLPVEAGLAFDAALLKADIRLLEGDPTGAAQEYLAIPAGPETRWGYSARLKAARAVDEAERFGKARWVALALLGWFLAAVAWGRAQARSVPEELSYAAPVLALVALASTAVTPAERTALLSLSLGGAALLYANGVVLRAHPPRGGWRALAALAGVAQSVGLLFVSVVLSGLWMRVADTLASGVE